MKRYAGVGARATPQAVQFKMMTLAATLNIRGWTLRSGGAIGADRAFEDGLSVVTAAPQPSDAWPDREIFTEDSELPAPAFHMAKQYHPAWDKCSPIAKCLLARNVLILLGPKFNEPVSFGICWTADGKMKGGTGHTIRVANACGIPFFNLWGMEPAEILGKIEQLFDAEGKRRA